MTVPKQVSSTDDVTLQVYDLGGSGPPLLLSHATGFCGPVWQPMAETLSERYHCIAFDFRAHGRSTRPVGRDLVWDGFAEDVLAVVDAISPDKPIPAVGHSMGGASLILAENMRPGALAAVWAFEPILFEVQSVGEPIREPSEIAGSARRRRPTFDSRDEVVERYGAKPPLSVLDKRALWAYAEHGFKDLADGTVTLRCLPDDEASVFEHHNSGARSKVGSMTIPLAMAASGDGRPPAQAVVAAAAEYSNAELLTYDSLSHFGPLEDPERIAADVMAWMETSLR